MQDHRPRKGGLKSRWLSGDPLGLPHSAWTEPPFVSRRTITPLARARLSSYRALDDYVYASSENASILSIVLRMVNWPWHEGCPGETSTRRTGAYRVASISTWAAPVRGATSK